MRALLALKIAFGTGNLTGRPKIVNNLAHDPLEIKWLNS